MCLTVPGRVVAVASPEPGLRTARVDFRGLVKPVNLVYLPETRVGDYVIVQAGFAIRRLTEAEALEALEYARQIDALAARPGDSLPAPPPAPANAAP